MMRLFILIKIFFCFFPLINLAKTIVVEQKGKISSLKTAQDLADNGDTIIVKKGFYSSVNTIINKEITILGEGYPVLDATYQDEVIIIRANNVKFDGF